MSKRVVTLIASATEIVAALGREGWLVGRSHECDFPPSICSLPALTEAKFDVSGNSAEIDAKVQAAAAGGLSVYRVFEDLLRDLAPDVIVTQDHCDVCAVALSDVEAAVQGWAAAGDKTQLVSLKPDGLPDIYADILRVSEALEAKASGEELVAGMQKSFADLAEQVAGAPRQRVAFVEWSRPLMSGGNWMPDLVRYAGGADLFGRAGEKSVPMEWDAFQAADPDVIIVAPCGYDLEESVRDLEMLEQYSGWDDLKAVASGELYCCDGNAYFNRPGPRLVDTAEIIAELLHPERVEPVHEGEAWIRITPE